MLICVYNIRVAYMHAGRRASAPLLLCPHTAQKQAQQAISRPAMPCIQIFVKMLRWKMPVRRMISSIANTNKLVWKCLLHKEFMLSCCKILLPTHLRIILLLVVVPLEIIVVIRKNQHIKTLNHLFRWIFLQCRAERCSVTTGDPGSQGRWV